MSLKWILLILLNDNLYAQTSIQTDRPDQTECPFTTPTGYLQSENGFSYESVNKNYKAITIPTILWKYGINKHIELRLITEIETVKNYGKKNSGFVPTTIGFKAVVCEEKGILPAIAFIGHLTIPSVASKNFKATYYAPLWRFNMQHSLSKKVSLSYNLGAEWDGETPEPIFIYTLTTGVAISEKIGSYMDLLHKNKWPNTEQMEALLI